MTAAALLTELRSQGATIAVRGNHLRIEAPTGTVTPELRRVLTEHKAELLALLTAALPTQDPSRLTAADCLDLLTEMHASIRMDYAPGALALLDTGADLRQRFEATEARIDALAKMPSGPTEADFRAAIEAHAAVWRELSARYRAQQERQTARPDPMPELPPDTVAAIGFGYADGEPGTWERVRCG